MFTHSAVHRERIALLNHRLRNLETRTIQGERSGALTDQESRHLRNEVKSFKSNLALAALGAVGNYEVAQLATVAQNLDATISFLATNGDRKPLMAPGIVYKSSDYTGPNGVKIEALGRGPYTSKVVVEVGNYVFTYDAKTRKWQGQWGKGNTPWDVFPSGQTRFVSNGYEPRFCTLTLDQKTGSVEFDTGRGEKFKIAIDTPRLSPPRISVDIESIDLEFLGLGAFLADQSLLDLRRRAILEAYLTHLGRQPEIPELLAWLQDLATGVTEMQMRSALEG